MTLLPSTTGGWSDFSAGAVRDREEGDHPLLKGQRSRSRLPEIAPRKHDAGEHGASAECTLQRINKKTCQERRRLSEREGSWQRQCGDPVPQLWVAGSAGRSNAALGNTQLLRYAGEERLHERCE
jgi:hypothetical protein